MQNAGPAKLRINVHTCFWEFMIEMPAYSCNIQHTYRYPEFFKHTVCMTQSDVESHKAAAVAARVYSLRSIAAAAAADKQTAYDHRSV